MLRREPQQSRAPKRKGRNACRVPQQSGAVSRGRGAQGASVGCSCVGSGLGRETARWED